MTQVAIKKNGNGSLTKLVNDFFNNDFVSLPSVFDLNLGISEVPSVNIIENNSHYTIEMAAPGLEKKDFKIEVEKGILTVSAEKENEKKEERENYSRREYSYENFSRSFDLPENLVSDKIDAKYENGILKLTLPKKEMSIDKPKKEIKVN